MSSIHVARNGYITKQATLPVVSRQRGAASASSRLLLLGEGTNNSAIIIDSSVNAYTVTRVGNPIISTARFPTGMSSSIYCATDHRNRLAIDWNSNFAIATNSDFTIELYFNFNSYLTYGGLVSQTLNNTNGSWNNGWGLQFEALTNRLSFYYGINSPASPSVITSSNTISTNTWYHIAVCRVNNTLRMFIDGVQRASATSSEGFASGTPFLVNSERDRTQGCDAYYSNIRFLPNVGLYSGNFVPPAAPITASPQARSRVYISGEGANNSTTITDTAGGLTLTRVGDTKISTTTAPTGMTSSIYFDGGAVRDYLTLTGPSLSASVPFTIEGWINFETFTSANTYPYFFHIGTDLNNRISFYRNVASSGRFTVEFVNSGTYTTINGTNVTTQIGTWYHLALTNDGTTRRFFVNGILEGSTTAGVNGGTGYSIGNLSLAPSADNQLKGYISNFRVITGAALYTATFTPPTAPLSIDYPISTIVSNNIYGMRQLA